MKLVREIPRILTHKERQPGHDLPTDVVNQLKHNLETLLDDIGFQRVIYRVNDDAACVAYSSGLTEFRKENVLIDDGGTCILRSRQDFARVYMYWLMQQKKSRPEFYPGIQSDRVLKIAIRDYDGANSVLYNRIVALLVPHTGPLLDAELAPTIGSTKVHALRRF